VAEVELAAARQLEASPWHAVMLGGVVACRPRASTDTCRHSLAGGDAGGCCGVPPTGIYGQHRPVGLFIAGRSVAVAREKWHAAIRTGQAASCARAAFQGMGQRVGHWQTMGCRDPAGALGILRTGCVSRDGSANGVVGSVGRCTRMGCSSDGCQLGPHYLAGTVGWAHAGSLVLVNVVCNRFRRMCPWATAC
jgi:hypothetical protein